MIFFTFLYQVLSMSASQIDKTIYLVEGEEYKVNLDSIFSEISDNSYSFVSENKGFTLDTSNLKLKSDQGTYSIQPTKILRQRQLVSLGDYQGTGQFGILDEYDLGHRICYNSDAIINLDQCIELDNTATSYDFVFIQKDTIAVSKIRTVDQQFGVTIYQNKEIISEFYFVPSKTYAQVTQTILEYCIFGQKKYLLFGVTELDSNIEFLQIQLDLTLLNTNKVIDKSTLPDQTATTLQVYDIRGTLNKVYIVCQSNNQAKLVISATFENIWSSSNDYLYSYDYRGLELGYSFIYSSVTESYLECEQDYYNIRSKSGQAIFSNLFTRIKQNSQVKYTLNYFIVLQDNKIIVSTFQKLSQRSNAVEGTILKIDVDFQNDVLIVFTDTKILTYYLKQATLQYQSNTITQSLDLVIIKAVSGQNEQTANINFQVLSKQDYNLYLLRDLTQDLYCNRVFYSPKNSIPLTGISGADIKVDGQVDDQVQIIPNYLNEYGITSETTKKIILEQLISSSYNPFLFRQFDDFSFSIYDCRLNNNVYQCNSPVFTITEQNQKVSVQYHQIGTPTSEYALLNEDGLSINIYKGKELQSIIQTFPANQFINFKVGSDRLFVYTKSNYILFYYFPSGEVINQLDLSQYGQPQGELITNLWINQYKSNLIVVTYGEDLIIGRFTSQFRFIQRITIKWVVDVQIIADNKFIVLSTDKTNKKLTQYILEDGVFRIVRELDTHGYVITGDRILIDYVYAEIVVQAQKDQQKALLLYGDTELARNSLLKVIKLQNDEYAVNVIYNSQWSSLLKRSTDAKKNSSIIDLTHRQQDVETDITKIPSKFSQQLDLKYIYTNSFTQNKVETMKNLYLEYQFYNLTANQDNDNKISYKNQNNQVKIPIKPNTFQGQVRTIALTQNDYHIQLTRRFKNYKQLLVSPKQSICKQVVQYGKILCIRGTSVEYRDLTGQTISQVSLKSLTTTDLKQLTISYDEQYALVQSTGQIMLIYISQNEIKSSQAFYQWDSSIDISIFYKGWLVAYYSTYLNYYQFQVQENNLWTLNRVDQFYIYGIQAIQYDPQSYQIFYSTGYQYLSYFISSLEGTTLNKGIEYQLNIADFLKTQKVYQIQTRIENIKIITQQQKTYLLLATSYGNILNMTIKSDKQEFKINSIYLVNGPSRSVKDIQIIDDYVLIQNQDEQFLFKNTNDWQLDKPYLTLETITASNFMGLFKNGSEIIHIYSDKYGQNLYQDNIDDDIYLKISDLNSYKPGNIVLGAFNGYSQTQVSFLTIRLADDESSNLWIWIVVSIIAVVAIAGGGFYCYKKRQEKVDPLLG